MCPCGVCQCVHISLHHRDAQSFAQCGIAEEFLNDDTITPHPVDLAMSMIHADHPEAYLLMQPQTCRILREDPRHELPEPQVCVEVAETFEGDTPCPCATCTGAHGTP